MTIGVSMISDRTMSANHYTGAGTVYAVEAANGDLYCLYVNSFFDVVFVKSTDGGVTWSSETTVFSGTATAIAVWYDRWSDISAGLIHCVYTESSGDDTLYRSIDTENSDSLSTETTVFAGTSTSSAGCLSVGGGDGEPAPTPSKEEISDIISAVMPDGKVASERHVETSQALNSMAEAIKELAQAQMRPKSVTAPSGKTYTVN